MINYYKKIIRTGDRLAIQTYQINEQFIMNLQSKIKKLNGFDYKLCMIKILHLQEGDASIIKKKLYHHCD